MNKLLFTVLIVLFSAHATHAWAITQDQATSVEQVEIININLAPLETLVLLPGIGKAKAAAIIQFRQDFGPFEDLDELLEVKGIGEKLLKGLEGKISL